MCVCVYVCVYVCVCVSRVLEGGLTHGFIFDLEQTVALMLPLTLSLSSLYLFSLFSLSFSLSLFSLSPFSPSFPLSLTQSG